MDKDKIEKLKEPNIFLIDAVGALISVVFLFIPFSFDEFFGMPKNVIKIFICIAGVFIVYSSTIHFIKPTNWKFYLKIVATLNIGYCLFTIYQILKNIDTLTFYGYLYFLTEILIITGLSVYEIKNASKTTTR